MFFEVRFYQGSIIFGLFTSWQYSIPYNRIFSKISKKMAGNGPSSIPRPNSPQVISSDQSLRTTYSQLVPFQSTWIPNPGPPGTTLVHTFTYQTGRSFSKTVSASVQSKLHDLLSITFGGNFQWTNTQVASQSLAVGIPPGYRGRVKFTKGLATIEVIQRVRYCRWYRIQTNYGDVPSISWDQIPQTTQQRVKDTFSTEVHFNNIEPPMFQQLENYAFGPNNSSNNQPTTNNNQDLCRCPQCPCNRRDNHRHGNTYICRKCNHKWSA